MNKRIAALPLIVIVGLGIIGFAYAMWKDTVTIKGTVEMGSFRAAFDYSEPPKCVEYWMDKLGVLHEGEYLDKPVGEQTCKYEGEIYDEHSGKKGYERLVIEVTNAYPCYRVHVFFIIRNIGTVGGYIESYTFEDDGSGEPITWVFEAGSKSKGYFVNADGKPVIDIELVNGLPIQLPPCTPNKMEIDMHFKQPLLECHTYKFKVTVNCVSKLD